jgi:hypothetical protein
MARREMRKPGAGRSRAESAEGGPGAAGPRASARRELSAQRPEHTPRSPVALPPPHRTPTDVDEGTANELPGQGITSPGGAAIGWPSRLCCCYDSPGWRCAGMVGGGSRREPRPHLFPAMVGRRNSRLDPGTPTPAPRGKSSSRSPRARTPTMTSITLCHNPAPVRYQTHAGPKAPQSRHYTPTLQAAIDTIHHAGGRWVLQRCVCFCPYPHRAPAPGTTGQQKILRLC